MCKMLSVWWLFCTTMYPRNVSSFYRPCLWHGEKMEVLNKMKNNFQVRKKSAGYCCGLMFAKAAQMLLGQEKESASWRAERQTSNTCDGEINPSISSVGFDILAFVSTVAWNLRAHTYSSYPWSYSNTCRKRYICFFLSQSRNASRRSANKNNRGSYCSLPTQPVQWEWSEDAATKARR